mmetsp:Transcript_6210/g.10092  ORF Transcript_6210/g.10092 Transcript_6210/m.10092 type:complete len:106 (-) Transcript_6210:2407-2724(-)|eukprot:CAMPEP_0170497384 /NCGR_PEP_ID=MMETSP0208-20121228/24636_1 /TAXON_ID=197538 /ORGANISM="Strombidium inclinatum, Strain S3" /LENGTH=105 /DNA_ID=CAMNT_0010774183 /DNA_START=229 /DNA_END=546 /DNA_ORIENTATION=+
MKSASGKNSSKPASGRMTPPSGYSGGGGQNTKSRFGEESNSVQMSNEQSASERLMYYNDRNGDDLRSVDRNIPDIYGRPGNQSFATVNPNPLDQKEFQTELKVMP